MDRLRAIPRAELVIHAATAGLFLWLFARPLELLGRDWLNDPNSGHGLLLAPLSLWLAWSAGVRGNTPHVRPW